MDDKNFKEQYKKEFDSICASEELKNTVKNLKPQKPRRIVTPFKATIGTVAAAIMIFAAVHEYRFETDTSGVISENVVSTQLPKTEFSVIEKKDTSSETQLPQKNDESVPTEKNVMPEQTTTSASTTKVQKPEESVVTTKIPATTKTPVATKTPATTKTPVATKMPSVTATPSVEETENVGIMLLSEDDQVSGSKGAAGSAASPTIQIWTLEEYYEYLGTNVSQKIAGQYTGTYSFEFEVGSDGLPLDDTTVLSFATNSGAKVRITVSKHILFDESMSGTVVEAGSGYNAYKVSNGIYYNIYATDTVKEEVVDIVNSL